MGEADSRGKPGGNVLPKTSVALQKELVQALSVVARGNNEINVRKKLKLLRKNGKSRVKLKEKLGASAPDIFDDFPRGVGIGTQPIKHMAGEPLLFLDIVLGDVRANRNNVQENVPSITKRREGRRDGEEACQAIGSNDKLVPRILRQHGEHTKTGILQ